MHGDESLVLVMVVAMHCLTGHTNNDSGDELERMINHGVTPQQDGLRRCTLPLTTVPNVTEHLAGNKPTPGSFALSSGSASLGDAYS